MGRSLWYWAAGVHLLSTAACGGGSDSGGAGALGGTSLGGSTGVHYADSFDGGGSGGSPGSGIGGSSATGTGGAIGMSGGNGAGGATGSAGATGVGGANGVGGAVDAGGPNGVGGANGTGGSIMGRGGAGGTAMDGSGIGGSRIDAGAGADSGAAPWRPFNASSPWNTLIADDATVDPASATMISDFSSIAGETTLWINIQQFSVPVYWVDGLSTASVTVRSDLGGSGFRTGAASDSVAAGSGPAPIPAGATPAAGTDRHLAIIDRSTGTEWGFWDANNAGANWTAGEASTLDLSSTGVRPPERSNPWWAGHGPRACGFGLIAGLITADEIRAGRIEHALVLAYPHIRSRFYASPASSAQGTTAEAISTRGILCGGHIQLDPALDITTLNLSPAALAVARALQRYGAFIGDFSGAVSIYADASTDARAYFGSGILDNNSVSRIPLNQFRVLTIGTQFDNGN
jgi:hypothetical protein